MRHNNKFRKLGRGTAHRMAMLSNLAADLIEHERIETTVARAKELRMVVEPLITKAGEDTLHNRRQAFAKISKKSTVHKLFAEIGPRYKERPGGYTRIIKSGVRAGVKADKAIIELVDSPVVAAKLEEKAPTAQDETVAEA